MSSPCLHSRGGGCRNHHVNSPSASLVQGQWYPTTTLKLSYKKRLPSYKGWIILTTFFNSMNFKLYLNLRENMEQRKPMADEDVPTVGFVYKKTCVSGTDSTRVRAGNLKGSEKHTELTYWTVFVKYTGALIAVLMYKSCLWRKQNCRLS